MLYIKYNYFYYSSFTLTYHLNKLKIPAYHFKINKHQNNNKNDKKIKWIPCLLR